MLYLDKNHDPRKNGKLIFQMGEKKLEIGHAIKETERLFQDCMKNTISTSTSKSVSFHLSQLANGIFPLMCRLFLTKKGNDNLAAYDTCIDEAGIVYPGWKEQLDDEYIKLLNNIDREVCVGDFGAVGDGITDNTEVFRKAIGDGRVKVHIPPGVFIVKGISLPSWTYLIGSGKGTTTLKLHNDAPKRRRLVTNAHHWRGNCNIAVESMTLDWNVERLGPIPKTSAGGNQSSCLTFANVTFGWIKNVEAINPGLHCFDISSTFYDYSGDGYRARGGSKYIWLDQLNGYGFGDDGITTHHSDNIFISNCHMCDPSGRAHKKGFSNSNGIEVDDGSRNVWLYNNSTSRCFGGVEIKAHHNSSAACNVQIIGHLSVNDNRSFNFRHIGHHAATDPESKTAYNIKATNLISLAPVYTDLYAGSTPRGLVVSGYKNVVINNFTLIGDPDYHYDDNPVIAIQYRARNLVLNNVSFRYFKNAGVDLRVFGGENRADHVHISNVTIFDSAPKAVHIGAGIENATVSNLIAIGEKRICGLLADNHGTQAEKIHTNGYKTPISIAGK